MAEPGAPADRCPRCGGGFHCGAAGAGPCACTSVRLEPGTLAALRATFSGCLCLACLTEIAAGAAVAPGPPWRTMPACPTRSP